MKKPERGLTDLEQDIMKVLWDNERDMTINEISEALSESEISVPSVAQAIRRLTTKKVVEVGTYTLVKNVYARTFKPCLTRDEYVCQEFARIEKYTFSNGKKAFQSMVMGLVDMGQNHKISKEQIADLEKIVEKSKKELQD